MISGSPFVALMCARQLLTARACSLAGGLQSEDSMAGSDQDFGLEDEEEEAPGPSDSEGALQDPPSHSSPTSQIKISITAYVLKVANLNPGNTFCERSNLIASGKGLWRGAIKPCAIIVRLYTHG